MPEQGEADEHTRNLLKSSLSSYTTETPRDAVSGNYNNDEDDKDDDNIDDDDVDDDDIDDDDDTTLDSSCVSAFINTVEVILSPV